MVPTMMTGLQTLELPLTSAINVPPSPLGDKIVSGVGGLKTTVQGIRTVEVESIYKENKYIL